MSPPAPADGGAGRLLWVPLAALLLGLLLQLSPLGELLSRPLSDWQQRQAAPTTPPAGVLVVDIDDASLQALRPLLGPWPFKRDVYALVVEQLRDLGARAIAIDLLLGDAHEGDLALARAIARPGAPVVLAAAGLRYAQDDAGPADLQARLPAARPMQAPGFAALLPAQPWPALALPAQTLWPAAGTPPRMGIITTPLDDDGLLRRLPLWHSWRDQRLPTLPLAVWAAVDGGAGAATLPRHWPLDKQGRVAPAFAGPAAAAPTLPFAQVARVALGLDAPGALAAAVQGRVVWVGSSALLADSVMTVSGQLGGTQVLAQSYAALQGGHLLQPPAAWAQALLLLLALLPATLAWRRGRADLRRDAAAAVLAGVLMLALAWALLAWGPMPTWWAPALATLLTGFVASVVAHQRWLARSHRQLAYERAVADAANQAKTAFLANVSHEIRTPMNALLGVAELLDATPLTEVQRRHVQVFRDSGQTLHELINDLLDLSRIEAGRFELNEAPFSLHALLAQLQALLGQRAEHKGLQLGLDLAANVPDAVRGDRRRVQQALTNLVANAIKFAHSGSVHIGVACGDAPHEVVFTITDTGIGIVPSKLELIFEPFTQADGSVTRQYGGTGLGLSITRSIVLLMQGRISVQSTPGQGSVFTLVVPLPPAALAPAERPPAALPVAAAPVAAQAPAPTHAVLLAEDSEVNVYIFEGMLADHQLRIDVASNGITALQMACDQAYHLVFMDVQMPGMDGLGVTRALRQFEARTGRARTPVVALTANAFAQDVHDSLAAGCDLHLPKPFSKAQLTEALARFLVPGLPLANPAIGPAAEPGAGAEATVLNTTLALQQMGGDRSRLAGALAHAGVFIARWPQDFEEARVQHNTALMQGLVHDLNRVATDIGAGPLAEQAAQLEEAIVHGLAPALQAQAQARVHQALTPVVVALGKRAA